MVCLCVPFVVAKQKKNRKKKKKKKKKNEMKELFSLPLLWLVLS
jgi:hypothetical protein